MDRIEYFIKDMTVEDFRLIIKNGDDTHNNQVRVRKNGSVFLSQDTVGADNLDDIAFRLESFDAHDDYVGIEAAQDDIFITRMYVAIKENWEKGCPETYLDNWNSPLTSTEKEKYNLQNYPT